MSITIKPISNPVLITAPPTLTDNLIEVWQPSDASTLFGSHNSIDGNIVGGAYAGNVIFYANDTDYTEMDAINSLWDGVNTKFSISMWIKPNGLNVTHFLASKYNGNNAVGARIMYIASVSLGKGRVLLGERNLTTTYHYWDSDAIMIANGVMQHIVLTVDLDTLTATMYRDGVAYPNTITTVNGGVSVLESDTTTFKIARLENSSGGFNGVTSMQISQTALWSRVIDASEVTALYNGGIYLPYASW